MARSRKLTNKEIILNALSLSNVWKQDNYGHYKTSLNGKEYRLKIQETSIRFEVKNQELKEWINLYSDYYKNIELVDDGKKLAMQKANRKISIIS